MTSKENQGFKIDVDIVSNYGFEAIYIDNGWLKVT